MAGFRYLWLIETKSGKIRHRVSKGRKCPMPDEDGFINLSGFKYGVNPQRFRDWTFKISKWQRKRYYRVQFWKENDPEPLNFFHITMPEPRFTSKMITTVSTAKKISEVLPKEQFDIIKMALLLSLFANIAVIVWLISQIKTG